MWPFVSCGPAFRGSEASPPLVSHVPKSVPMVAALTLTVAREAEIEVAVATPRTVVMQVVL